MVVVCSGNAAKLLWYGCRDFFDLAVVFLSSSRDPGRYPAIPSVKLVVFCPRINANFREWLLFVQVTSQNFIGTGAVTSSTWRLYYCVPAVVQVGDPGPWFQPWLGALRGRAPAEGVAEDAKRLERGGGFPLLIDYDLSRTKLLRAYSHNFRGYAILLVCISLLSGLRSIFIFSRRLRFFAGAGRILAMRRIRMSVRSVWGIRGCCRR
jgi:hypothetical protein